MIKGFVLITFILLIWQNFSLRKAYLNQREYFIKVLSHDLRVANIAHIRGLELLEKVYSSDLILDIKESCKYSLDMISMLLNIYRFEKGEQILDYEYFNPNLLITECCKNFSDKISEKAIFINIVNDLKKCVYADKKAIYKVFLILLSTALENAFASSKISIKLFQTKNMFSCSFIYSGNILSEEECNRIFSNNHKFLTVGQGIKLMLCKKIIDFHNGKMIIKTYENKNVFQIDLPLDINQKKNNLGRIRPLLSNLAQ